MLDRTFDHIKNIDDLSKLKLPMLFFGLAIWVVTPIIGNIPILLSIQLDLLKTRRRKPKFLTLNNLLLVLVVLSLTIYISSFEIFADTKVYLDIYKTLDTKGIFDNYIAKERYEFGLFLLLYPLHILTDGSEYLALFFFSLISNFIVTFYLSKKLSDKYYPTILLIIFSTFFYYSQLFYMRQFLALLLVMMAIVNLESSFIAFCIWSLLAIFTHSSSAIYIFIAVVSKSLFLVKAIKIKAPKINKFFWYICLAFLALIIISTAWTIYNNPQEIYKYANNIIDLLPKQQLTNSIQDRINLYDGRDRETFAFDIYRALATIVVGIFVIAKRHQKLTPIRLSLCIIYLISLLQIVFVIVTGFNQRIVYLFLTFYGFFFCIGLDDRAKPKLGLISLLTMFIAAANTYNFLTIQINMSDVDGWSFFDGQPLMMSVYDYVVYFFKSF